MSTTKVNGGTLSSRTELVGDAESNKSKILLLKVMYLEETTRHSGS